MSCGILNEGNTLALFGSGRFACVPSFGLPEWLPGGGSLNRPLRRGVTVLDRVEPNLVIAARYYTRLARRIGANPGNGVVFADGFLHPIAEPAEGDVLLGRVHRHGSGVPDFRFRCQVIVQQW